MRFVQSLRSSWASANTPGSIECISCGFYIMYGFLCFFQAHRFFLNVCVFSVCFRGRAVCGEERARVMCSHSEHWPVGSLCSLATSRYDGLVVFVCVCIACTAHQRNHRVGRCRRRRARQLLNRLLKPPLGSPAKHARSLRQRRCRCALASVHVASRGDGGGFGLRWPC